MNFTDFLDLRIATRHEDGVTVECALKDIHYNPDGSLHGGLIASIADEAVWCAIDDKFRNTRYATTTELKVNYLRAVSASEKLTARTRMLKTGRTLCVGSVELTDDRGALCAFATVTYMLLGEK